MTAHLYFIGIAGHTMRGLALAARDNGYTVTGLDEPAAPPGSDWLDQHNLVWWRHFDPVQLDGVTTVIVTGAHVTATSAPIVEARRRGLKIQSYAEFFGHLTTGEQVIAVSGTHGKTTTTALIAWLLDSAGRKPDFLIGIQPFNFDSSVRFQKSQVAVVEGDEYKASSLHPKSKVQYYHPNVLVLTSIEHDHPDVFPDLASVKHRFRDIVENLPKNGRLVACADSPIVLEVAAAAPCEVTTYGTAEGDYQARDIAFLPEGIEFDVEAYGHILGRVAVGLYGRHNVLNVLAAIATVLKGGLSLAEIIPGAMQFRGAYRRFNIVSAPDADITLVDDYAHHPTEVATNLEAAKLHFPGRRIVAVFRPHTYSRTRALLKEYHQAFANADLAFITDIEGARETGDAPKVNGQDIVEGLGESARFTPDRADLIEQITTAAKPGDVILCFTVSGYQNLAEELAGKLAN